MTESDINNHAVMYSVLCHAIYKLGKIFPTEFVAYKLTNLHTVVRVYTVATVYILEKFGGSCTGQGKFIVVSKFQVSRNTTEAN